MKNEGEELLLLHQGLIHRYASYYAKHLYLYGIEYEDLYQVGCIAILENYQNYQMDKGKMSTYFGAIIRYQMLDYIHHNSTITYVPKNLEELSRRLDSQNCDFYKRNGRNMNISEQLDCLSKINHSAYQTNLDLLKLLEKLIQYHAMSKRVFLNDFIEEVNFVEYEDFNQNLVIEDCLELDYSLEEQCISNLLIEDFATRLRKLNIRKENIEIFLNCAKLKKEGSTDLKTIAAKYKVSQQAIDRRYQRVLKKVRKNISLFQDLWEDER